LLRLLLVGLLYFAAGKLGLALAIVNASASAVWPPTGIALAAFLVLGDGVWPAILVSAFLVNVTTSGHIPSSLAIAAGNTLEGFVGAYLVQRFASGRQFIERAQDIFRFAVLAGLVAPAVSATVGVTSLAVSGLAAWPAYGSIWLTWWLGDVTGAIIVAPLLVLWAANQRVHFSRRQALEAALLLAALFSVTLFVFGGLTPPSVIGYPLEFLILPIVVWASFRFGQRDTVTVAALTSIIAIWGTLHGFGPFARETPNEALSLLQAFVSTAAITGLVLAAVVSERRQSQLTLQQQQEHLRLSRDELAVILKSAADGITARDAAGRLRYANDAAARQWGYRSGEALLAAPRAELNEKFAAYDEAGQPFRSSDLPEEQVLRGAPLATATIRYRNRETGEAHWSADIATPVYGSNGQLERVINVLHDITELKRGELEQRLLAQTSRLVSAPLDQDARLKELAALVVPYWADYCAIHVLDPDDSVRLVALTSRQPLTETQAAAAQGSQPPPWQSTRTVVEVMRSGQALLIPEITEAMLRANSSTDEQFEQLRASQLGSALILPLVTRGRALGALTFVRAVTDGRYSQRDLELAESLARQASLAVENARLFAEAQALNLELEQRIQRRTLQLQRAQTAAQAVSQRLLVAREEERAEMAREIHDELGQQLTGFKYDVVKLNKAVDTADPAALRAITQEMSQGIDATIETIRRIATELRPAILDDFGLLAAIHWQADEIQRRTGILARFQSQMEAVELERGKTIAIFRACQEALTNVARHSGATQVEVRVASQPNLLIVEIHDNGRGISATEMTGAKSLGLMGMRERIYLAGGTLDITGSADSGTMVRMQVPLA
jgi:PAS domain S-box-containing protein